jgi:hypothetical protein
MDWSIDGREESKSLTGGEPKNYEAVKFKAMSGAACSVLSRKWPTLKVVTKYSVFS